MQKAALYTVGILSLGIHIPITQPFICKAFSLAPIEAKRIIAHAKAANPPKQILQARRYIPGKSAIKIKSRHQLPTKSICKAWTKMVDGVKHFEGFRSKQYRCCGGVLTIGYGHTGKHVRKGSLTEKEAEEILLKELDETKEKVLDIVEVPLTNAQLAALTSFTFNCGTGSLRKLVDQPGRLNDGNYESVKKIMPLYRRAGGKIKDGLVRRRSWELSLWNA